jgi:hypothetical protein
LQLLPPQPIETHPGRPATQVSFDFDFVPAAPAAVDPNLPRAVKLIQQEHNARLLDRLTYGEIGTAELDGGKGLYGRRWSARLHDIRCWLWALGYPRDADPVPGRCVDAKHGLWTWSLTEDALELARRSRG